LQDNRSKPGRFGLIGISERVAILGGTLSLGPSPGGGTTIEVAMPARQENAENSDTRIVKQEHEIALT
jgi:glucose-6-phosphate-specific signal transduction histidine kinase